MITPNIQVKPGTVVTNRFGEKIIYPHADGQFRLEDVATGTSTFMGLNEFLIHLQLPGTTSSAVTTSPTAAVARIRIGGLYHRSQLTEQLQDQIDFKLALVRGMQILESQGVEIKAARFDDPEIRSRLSIEAKAFYPNKPISTSLRGGSIKLVAVMPRGRTLVRDWKRLEDADFNEIALADQNWKKGNRTSRGITTRMRELMTQALTESYLDKKKMNLSAALRWLNTLVREENKLRAKNGLDPLAMVAYGTLADHKDNIGFTAEAVARNGENWVSNNRSRGSTDTRALMVAEAIQVDECKLSIITPVKAKGWWQYWSREDRDALEEIDDIIRTRLWLIVVFDVATRMPLGWVLADKPSKEATLEALRMATRDKTREKILYDCEADPMPATGLGTVTGDNGYGIRNSETKSAILGMLGQTQDARAHHGVDKPYIERMFGTLESVVLNLVHGYTGRRAGQLPGYDPIKNGVLDLQELYGIITRYFVDEYPFEKHYGTTMLGARPAKVAEQINRDYGAIKLLCDHDRRIHLGWKSKATINDDGLKVFGLTYTSPELQLLREDGYKKVTVYSDPDSARYVTVVAEGHPELVLAELTWTAMWDLTIPEFLAVAEKTRAEDPAETEEFEERLARVRRARFDQLHFIATERRLARSYMTVEEARTKAAVVVTGMHSTPRPPLAGTAMPGSLGSADPIDGSRVVGSGFQPTIDNEDTERDVPAITSSFEKPDIKGKLK